MLSDEMLSGTAMLVVVRNSKSTKRFAVYDTRHIAPVFGVSGTQVPHMGGDWVRLAYARHFTVDKYGACGTGRIWLEPFGIEWPRCIHSLPLYTMGGRFDSADPD